MSSLFFKDDHGQFIKHGNKCYTKVGASQVMPDVTTAPDGGSSFVDCDDCNSGTTTTTTTTTTTALSGLSFGQTNTPAEGDPESTVVGDLTPTGGTGPFTYAMKAGAGDGDNGSYKIVGSQLQLSAAPSISEPTDSIRVEVTDSLMATFDDTFSVDVYPTTGSMTVELAEGSPLYDDASPGEDVGEVSAGTNLGDINAANGNPSTRLVYVSGPEVSFLGKDWSPNDYGELYTDAVPYSVPDQHEWGSDTPANPGLYMHDYHEMPYVGDYVSRVSFRIDASNQLDITNQTTGGTIDNSVGVTSGNDPNLLVPDGTIDTAAFQEVTFANGQTWKWQQEAGW